MRARTKSACSLLYPQCLDQRLAHSRCSGNICLVSAWEKAQMNSEEVGIFQLPWNWPCSPPPSWAPLHPLTLRKHTQHPIRKLPTTPPPLCPEQLENSGVYISKHSEPPSHCLPLRTLFWHSLKLLPLCDYGAALGPTFLLSHSPVSTPAASLGKIHLFQIEGWSWVPCTRSQ